ncbi:DUF955 domain-containing protein, partial [Bacillus thuringiensis]
MTSFSHIYYRKNFFSFEVFLMDPYVNICICITPGADISDDRIAKDLAVAESIWHPITFQIQEVIVLNELFRFFDREISYKNSIQSQEK